jgi:glyceraldehyde 3-phosphate dehydrogenase
MNFFPSFQLFNYDFGYEYKNIFLLLHRKSERIAISKRKFIFKHYKTLKSLNKMIKVGINGFGRIGRFVFRAAMKRNDIQIVGINDLCPVDYLAYMLKYDTMHGQFDGTIEADVENSKLIVNGQAIRITAERNPADLKWNEVEAEYVVESTGLFLSKDKAQAHIEAGAC